MEACAQPATGLGLYIWIPTPTIKILRNTAISWKLKIKQ